MMDRCQLAVGELRLDEGAVSSDAWDFCPQWLLHLNEREKEERKGTGRGNGSSLCGKKCSRGGLCS